MSALNALSRLAALVSLVSFFLPWFEIFGERVSGFALAQTGYPASLLWTLPVFAIFSLITSKMNDLRIHLIIGVLLGIGTSAFIVRAYTLGAETLLKSCSLYGAYAFVSGILFVSLLCASRSLIYFLFTERNEIPLKQGF